MHDAPAHDDTILFEGGFEKFGKQGKAAVAKELGKFHDMSIFVPIDPTKLTKAKSVTALAPLYSSSIKGRCCEG